MTILLLDLTGVLFDYDSRARTAALAEATGVSGDHVRELIFRSGFFARCVAGDIDEAQQRAALRELLRWDVDDETMEQVWSTGWTPRQDTLDVLGELPAAIDRALLTNNDAVMRQALLTRYPQLSALAAPILCAAQLGAAKPRPQAFTSALSILGVGPDDARFVDDTMANVEAARRVGIRSAQFLDPQQLRRDLQGWGLLG